MVDRDQTRPDARNEPVLAVNKIQGNILAGFNKDYQAHLYLQIRGGEVKAFKDWLQGLVPHIATTAEVLAFNRLFKSVRQRRRVETRTVMATWVNVALSFRALRLLAGNGKTLSKKAVAFEDYQKAKPEEFAASRFTDAAFRQGMAARSVEVLSDPLGAGKEWKFGGPGKEPDLVIIIASDSEAELGAEKSRILRSIGSSSGVILIHKQDGYHSSTSAYGTRALRVSRRRQSARYSRQDFARSSRPFHAAAKSGEGRIPKPGEAWTGSVMARRIRVRLSRPGPESNRETGRHQ